MDVRGISLLSAASTNVNLFVPLFMLIFLVCGKSCSYSVFQSVHIVKYYADDQSPKSWFEFVAFSNFEVQFKMDTGAEVNVIPKKLLDTVFVKQYAVEPTSILLEVYGGALLRPIGVINIPNCTLNNISLDLQFVIADVESVPLLGQAACEGFQLVNRTSRSQSCHTSH